MTLQRSGGDYVDIVGHIYIYVDIVTSAEVTTLETIFRRDREDPVFWALSSVWMWSNLERVTKPARQRITLPFNVGTAISEKDWPALMRGKYQDKEAKSGSLLSHSLSPTGWKGGRKEGGKYSVAVPHSFPGECWQFSFWVIVMHYCPAEGAWLTPWHCPKCQLPRFDESKCIQPGALDVIPYFFICDRLLCTCSFNILSSSDTDWFL